MKNIFNSEQSLFRNVEREKDKHLSHLLVILILPIITFILSAAGTALLTRLVNGLSIIKKVNTSMYVVMNLFISSGIVIMLVFLVVTLKEKRSIKTLGLVLSSKALKHYLRGLLIGLLMFAISLELIIISGKGQISFKGIANKGAILFIFTFLTWIVQGASEEIVLRGYMLGALAARSSIKFAVVISSVYFAALHLFNNGISVLSFINIILVGVFTTFYAIYEDGIWGVCGWHSAWNFAQGNLFGCPVSGMQLGGGSVFITQLSKGDEIITGGIFGPEASLVVTLVFIVGIVLSRILLSKRTNNN